MTYIYDILLNFNEELIEYFQWDDSDNIKYVKKIAIFKVSTKVLQDIVKNEVLFDSSFTSLVPKYEMNSKTSSGNLCLLTDGLLVVGVLIKENNTILLSRLLLDEENEALEIAQTLPTTDLIYKIIKPKKISDYYLTRKEVEIKSKLEKEIDHLYEQRNLDKLRYFYYDFTNKESDNLEFIYKYLKESLKNFDNKHLQLFDILLLSNINNE